MAPRVLPESERRTGRFDLPGAVTSTLGVASLVYGLSNAATSVNGVSHWGDTKVIVSLTAAAVLLTAFAVIELRSGHALLPMRVLRSRNRTGAYLIGLAVLGTVAWSAVANSLRSQAAAVKAGVHTSAAQAHALQAQMHNHALASGFSRGFIVSAAIMALALIIALTAIRVTRKDLAGLDPMAAPI